MKNLKIITLFFLVTVLAFGCKKDDTIEEEVHFDADFNGDFFTTTNVTTSSIFGVFAIIVQKDGDELQILLSGKDEGTYEVGGTDKSFTSTMGFYTEQSGTVVITEKNTTNRTIKGTVNMKIATGLTTTTPVIDITNGEFLVKY